MRFCQTCVLPDTRPGIAILPDGTCNACAGHREKALQIDWKKRRQTFETIVGEVRNLRRAYDCIIPVSGGKDSTYQVVKCLEHGLKVLGVTYRPPARTALGQQNLDNLIRLGVDHLDVTVNPAVERKFTYKSLVRTGSTGVPMHMGLYVLPLRLAVALNIPLVVWGESPAMEYGGSGQERSRDALDHEFLRTHGILQGTTVDDWVDCDLSARDLEAYRLPTEEDFRRAGIRSIFLGFYFNWSPQESLRVALEHGFTVRPGSPKVGYYNYADIDEDFISVHHYFKWLKFGFTRLFDNLSLEIRNGQMTRSEALRILEETGDQTPHDDIALLCGYLGITTAHFWEIAERFRNRSIWSFRDGRWQIEDFLIKTWKWSPMRPATGRPAR